jgi:hypothetical protein
LGFLLDGIREGVLLHGGGCEQSAGLPAVVGLFVLFETAAGGPLVSLRSTSLRLASGNVQRPSRADRRDSGDDETFDSRSWVGGYGWLLARDEGFCYLLAHLFYA